MSGVLIEQSLYETDFPRNAIIHTESNQTLITEVFDPLQHPF